jgi:hypothetical protein
MRTIELVMIESGRFVGKKGSWFHFKRKSSDDWSNPQDSTCRRHPILDRNGFGILFMTGHSKEAVAEF